MAFIVHISRELFLPALTLAFIPAAPTKCLIKHVCPEMTLFLPTPPYFNVGEHFCLSEITSYELSKLVEPCLPNWLHLRPLFFAVIGAR